ncbi:cytochrome b [Rhizobium sp. TRM96650]|uniref:cytochrome b n=1 Tax=unclassified Rhizobium TaxID=2613769 RepID=UPI0021E7F676|nr:cytochrome b/b6 domain-containing protein [Rhizobium sp. TRM96650]MCV3761270.1 hypothetical protein [Rhizobium sp. TRM96650]
MACLHAYAGIAILILTAVRLLLRHIQGVPAAPAGEPPIFRSAAKISEWTLYLLLLAMPVTGAAAYYLGYEGAGDFHADVSKPFCGLLSGFTSSGRWRTSSIGSRMCFGRRTVG